MLFLFVLLTAFSIGFVLMPAVIKVLKRARIGDHPGGRKIHKKFIPSMGGIGFFVAAAVSIAIWGWQFPLPDIRYLLGAISLMFFVGLRDDLVELKASHKLLGQLVAVVLVVVMGDVRIKDFHGFLGIGELNLFFSYTFSAFVLLVLTNAFNLIDGIDGLAGSTGLIVSGLLGIWFVHQGLDSFAVLSFSFFGGVLAFLFFNWHPAKIFMGDTGSLTLGFTLGTLVIAFMEFNAALPDDASWRFEPTFSTGIALMIFPLYDMARVFTRRIRRGQGPMTPDKSHVHHFLLRMGLKHNQVTLVLALVQLIVISTTLVLINFSDHIVLPTISAIVLILGYRLDRIAVRYVKKKVANEPRILDLSKSYIQKEDGQKSVKIDPKDFENNTINYN
ncbi:glycosyltransferase family 4 protein [Algoriphagus limi]|uniref:Undecaprenyl/decaprenyl-phosphate alpha-N-acetylglucosaminyl 1-phosphate transferase n=1 Tax=Algoriphagus limi TaxID=2975273 RepID=A0ABT2G4Z5_9BACT|nr:MraY family glycosyltransferase [Algoriphagus limi]MCS5489100.1 undecaprenyl/decaprenyl-phosphate alpha-N-acetylglucosaminyl 1-phosphate transferase [Algoriphagus limi]